jgi:DnaJ-class molecular chaperone
MSEISEPDGLRPGDEAAPEDPATAENICPDCGGSGHREDASRCQTCSGTGRVTEGIGGG